MEIDQNGLEVLDREQCLSLLAQATIGRVGLTTGALPTVLPVNYLLDRERILIRTGKGTKLSAALCGNVVAFEVDDFDARYHSGWSVVVTGAATVVTEERELEALERAPIPRWAPLGHGSIVEIPTDIVSGRALRSGIDNTIR